MSRKAEAEAWTRRKRRVIRNQPLIQLFATLAVVMPLPLVTLIFWVVFFVASPMIIQGMAIAWAATVTIYFTLTMYIRIKQRKP